MAFSGREFTFTKYPVTARKLTHRFPRPRRGYFITLKTRQFDFIPTIASEFCQPRNSSTPSCCTTGMTSRGVQISLPGRVAQSVTCLATDACLTANPGVASSIPVRSHTFVKNDHKMISTVILLPSADLFKKGCCQLQAKVCARITGQPLVQACPGKSVVR